MGKAVALILGLGIILTFLTFLGLLGKNYKTPQILPHTKTVEKTPDITFPLAITVMREKQYPGSDLKIEETLAPGQNYKRYIASYTSDGFKIYGLLTVPDSAGSTSKVPAIIFNHGYIPPAQYVTTERYVAYQDGFAKNGYVTYKSDYRGNGNSQGQAQGAYYSPDYTTDVLNALASVKKLPYVNPNKIGMWGHSMGGNLTFRALTVNPKDIKAAVIWSGVVGTYDDLINKWHPNRHTSYGDANIREHQISIRQNLIDKYGQPSQNHPFWQAIDPYSYISDITAPIQVHQGLSDEDVPPLFAQDFVAALKKNGKTVEYYTYEGADHNLSSPAFETAEQRSIDFFNKYLK